VRAERDGVLFESKWHKDFIPNRVPDGVERARHIFARAYLAEHNAWVKKHGIEDDELAALWRARETLLFLFRTAARGKKVSAPRTLQQLLALVEPSRLRGRR
jgi:hypothetical protein